MVFNVLVIRGFGCWSFGFFRGVGRLGNIGGRGLELYFGFLRCGFGFWVEMFLEEFFG